MVTRQRLGRGGPLPSLRFYKKEFVKAKMPTPRGHAQIKKHKPEREFAAEEKKQLLREPSRARIAKLMIIGSSAKPVAKSLEHNRATEDRHDGAYCYGEIRT